jgi:hypothetical protein
MEKMSLLNFRRPNHGGITVRNIQGGGSATVQFQKAEGGIKKLLLYSEF